MPNGQWPELGARGAAPGTAYTILNRILAQGTPRFSRGGYDRQPGAGMKMSAQSLRSFLWFFPTVYGATGVPSCQYRAEPARGAYAAPASDLVLWLLNRRLYRVRTRRDARVTREVRRFRR